jgi:predicted RNA-binding Zn-ribbon protein involved in translation (DUF1610 family)
MSDEARDLLVHGMAAAKAQSVEEARFYLEWVLRANCDLDQQTDAWYWLSTIATDETEKRDCLENVLAAYPNHPEARRDLAILEGRLQPDDIADPLHPVAPLAPTATLEADDIHRFVCPSCGGKMAYQAERGGLFCQFCGHSEAQNGTSPVTEQDWVAAIYTDKGHKWELPTQRTLSCQGCGATVALLPAQVSAECPFCGTPLIVATEEQQELIQPGGVAPFAFDAAAALAHARRFIEEERFRPDDLDELATLIPPRPVYLPFWTFDVSGQITWSGFIPEVEYKSVHMVPTQGVLGAIYEEVMVPGTKSVPDALLAGLKYDTSALVPYSPELLADWPAEIYSVSLADAAVIAHSIAYEKSRLQGQREIDAGFAGTVQGVTVDHTDLAIISYKLVLLPVWLTGYTYEGRQFPLVVNGQNGQAHGEVPRNGVQRVLGEIFG